MIAVSNISKTFKIYRSPGDRLREFFYRKPLHDQCRALAGVSFAVRPGETLGIIGENGAGKSTLLKILMGILMPDSGHVSVSGRVTGLLELTTGFNPEFSGIQNVYLNGVLRGMSKAELDEKRDSIIAFSELGDFITAPLKTYSTGMAMRLAFSIAIHADPQAFIVDEALAVGDAYFQQKCISRIRQFKAAGGSVVLVSHDMNMVKVLCDSALLLERGTLLEHGDPLAVINAYNFQLARKSSADEPVERLSASASPSYGSMKAEIRSVAILNGAGADSDILVSGEPCTIRIRLKATLGVGPLTVGVMIRDRFGQDIFGTNTHHLKSPLSLEAGSEGVIDFIFNQFNIGSGRYTLTVAAHTGDVHVHDCYHWIDAARSFEVVGSPDFFSVGLVRLTPQVKATVE